jgi:ABC-type polysaccharide/polyol phosphate transport system ATPase subunit
MSSAGILVLASHSVALLEQYCTQGAVLAHGVVQFYGPMLDAAKFYANSQG